MKLKRERIRQLGQTYFVTSQTWDRRPFFRHERWAELFVEVIFHYRGDTYLLHEFVLMPDHFHLLISPLESLEKALQLIKGGFSHRAKFELQTKWTIWQRGFSDHRIRDFHDYEIYRGYIHQNAVKAKLSESAPEYRFSSASDTFELDAVPQRLKPVFSKGAYGTAEAVPLPNSRGPMPANTEQSKWRDRPEHATQK